MILETIQKDGYVNEYEITDQVEYNTLQLLKRNGLVESLPIWEEIIVEKGNPKGFKVVTIGAGRNKIVIRDEAPMDTIKRIHGLCVEALMESEKADHYLKKIFSIEHYYADGCGYMDGLEAVINV